MSSTRKELESSLSKLSLAPENQKKPNSQKKTKAPVADSWEDESDSGSDTDRPLTAQSSAEYPDPPPPTPISPMSPYSRNDDRFISPYGDAWSSTASSDSASPVRERDRAVRPEKTDAVARRLIAGALGVRAPKKTEEQRAYEKALREKEIKRRGAEKEEERRREEEKERARKAAWGDD